MAQLNIKIVPTILLLILPLVHGQSLATINYTSVENVTTSTAAAEETYDYVIKLVFGLESEKIPEFIIKSIYDKPDYVTFGDVIALYKLGADLTLSRCTKILNELKYDSTILYSADALDKILADLDVDFKNFYDSVFLRTLNVSGVQIRYFLGNLSVDSIAFSAAITFGEGDPLEVFKRGNISEATVRKAVEALNKTLEDVFNASREVIFDAVALKSTEDVLKILQKYDFEQSKALKLWAFLNITEDDVEEVRVFSELLKELRFTLDEATYLGILTNKSAAINNAVYVNIEDKMKLAKLYAQSLNDNTTVPLKIIDNDYDNMVTFNLEGGDNFTTFAEVATTKGDLLNCVLVTLNDDRNFFERIEKVSYKNSHLQAELNISEVVQGSPLICNDKVYGLAKEIDDGNIIFDTFEVRHNSAFSSFTRLFNPYILLVSISLYLKV